MVTTQLTDASIHYVKFRRGPRTHWEALKNTLPNKVDDDTLYFIYENAENIDEGQLYLGRKLISGSGVGGSSNVFNINDLRDVYIDNESLQDKQILVFNDTTQKWENATLSEIIDTGIGVMQGATTETNGISGLVPVPTAGLTNRFLRVDGTWSPVNIPTFDAFVFSFDANNQVSLQDYNLAPVGAVPIKTQAGLQWSTAVGKLNRQIVTAAELHELEDNGMLDPDYIYMVARDNSDSSNRYDEYMVINGRVELLGVFGSVSMQDYVPYSVYNPQMRTLEAVLNDTTDPETNETIPGLVSRVAYIEASYISKSAVGNLQNLLLSPGNDNLVDQVNSNTTNIIELDERLKWQALQDDDTD